MKMSYITAIYGIKNLPRCHLLSEKVKDFEYLYHSGFFDHKNNMRHYISRRDIRLSLEQIELLFAKARDDNVVETAKLYKLGGYFNKKSYEELSDNERNKELYNEFVRAMIEHQILDEKIMETIVEEEPEMIDNLVKHQILNMDFINKHINIIKTDDLIKYQNVDLQNLEIKKSVLNLFFADNKEEIRREYLWYHDKIEHRLHDVIEMKYSVLVFDEENRNGLFINKFEDDESIDTKSDEEIDDDYCLSYGFVVRDKSTDMLNGFEYNKNFKLNSEYIMSGYYHDYKFDMHEDRKFKMIEKKENNNENMLSVNNYNDNFNVLNYEQAYDKIKDAEEELDITMIIFDLKRHTTKMNLSDYLSIDQFKVINIMNKIDFMEKTHDEFDNLFVKYFVDNYGLYIDKNLEGDMSISIEEKVKEYMNSVPDISRSVEFRKNPAYKNVNSSAMMVVDKKKNKTYMDKFYRILGY